MSENLHITEIMPPLPIESIEQTEKRLRSTLDVIPYTEEMQAIEEEHPGKHDLLWVPFTGNRLPDGHYEWNRRFSPLPPEGSRRLNPKEEPGQTEAFQSAATALLENDSVLTGVMGQEGRWWLGSSSGEYIENNIRQAIRVSEGEQTIDIVNCLDKGLNNEHFESIRNVFNAVASYTGNKIFDRVKGVALLPGSEFEEGVAGAYQNSSGVVRINMDEWGKDSGGTELGRYQRYFDAGQTNFFEISLAHELGHAMDIATVDEAEAHDIKKDTYWWNAFGGRTNDFSAFGDKLGWTHHIEGEAFDRKTVHRMDDAQEIEWRENTPTGYARTNPKEDFAESFAIAVLKGRMENLRNRERIIGETMLKATGTELIGPKMISVRELTPDEILTPIREIGLAAYLPEDQAA